MKYERGCVKFKDRKVVYVVLVESSGFLLGKILPKEGGVLSRCDNFYLSSEINKIN